MAVANASLGGVDPASTACKSPPMPSGMMIGPSTNQCYIHPMQRQILPTGYCQTAQQGAQGYGYYNPNIGGFIGSSGVFGYCQGGQHMGFEAGQAMHCGTPVPYMYQRPSNPNNVYAGQQAGSQCQYNQQNAQMYQQMLAHPNCAAMYRDLVKQQNAGFQGCASQGITSTPYVQLGSAAYWGGEPNHAPTPQATGPQSHANAACPGGGRCFNGLATSAVGACGRDAGGVPVSIAALNAYNSAAADAQNSMANWGNELHAPNPGSTLQCAQWLGLEGSTRGLCLLAALTNELPGGLCVSYQGSGGSNSPGANFFSVPCGCTVTFSHEMQEMLNPNCSGPNGQDTSDVRFNTPGTPAHCNNFKSCGVGYQCFDTALTAFFGTDYGNSPNAWQFAKTPSYACGNLLAPGGGSPLGPSGPCGGHCVIGPGGIIIHIPGPAPIPQAPNATSDTCASPNHRKKPTDPGEKGMKTFAYGGPVRGYAGGGGVMTDPFACFPRFHAACPTPTPTPTPNPTPAPKPPPICVTVAPTPAPAPPPAPNIVPFQSASPAYPYRGVVCTNQISYPGFETWNFPLGSPETPGGPGIPTPPGTPQPPAGNCIIPITNIPGVTGILPCGQLLGPCGPIGSPGVTGNPCTPTPSPAPQPCNPCNPCVPAPCTPTPSPASPFGTVSPFMPCYMGVSPWPSPQNVWGGCLPQTPWLPGGKVDNGLGPSPAMPASPAYGLAPSQNAAFNGPGPAPPVMPFASPSTTSTTTGLCTNHPSFGQWDQQEDQGMLANNYTQGGNAPWGFLANLQNGNVQFPSVTNTTTTPGLAPVTPGQCGNLYAYPGSDKWTGTNPNPYIHGCAPAPCGPGPSPGGDGDCDWDDGMGGMGGGHHHPGGGGHGQCLIGQNGSFTGGACFGGTPWANQGVWGGWGSPSTNEPPEDNAEAWAQQHWNCMWNADISKQQGLHPGTSTGTVTGAIPCWHPPDWNAPNNPGYTNTSNPGNPGSMPTWPGQPMSGGPAVGGGGYSAQATPFLNGDLYKPGFETVGAGFQGNPWQPNCIHCVNPGAISMGLAGFQLPAPTPAPAPSPSPAPGGGGGGWGHHAKGGAIGDLVDVALSPGEGVLVDGQKMQVPGQSKYSGDTTKNDTYRTKLPPGAIVLPRTVNGNAEREARFVAAVKARKSPTEALRRAHG